jgi:hypothetical protein
MRKDRFIHPHSLCLGSALAASLSPQLQVVCSVGVWLACLGLGSFAARTPMNVIISSIPFYVGFTHSLAQYNMRVCYPRAQVPPQQQHST